MTKIGWRLGKVQNERRFSSGFGCLRWLGVILLRKVLSMDVNFRRKKFNSDFCKIFNSWNLVAITRSDTTFFSVELEEKVVRGLCRELISADNISQALLAENGRKVVSGAYSVILAQKWKKRRRCPVGGRKIESEKFHRYVRMRADLLNTFHTES